MPLVPVYENKRLLLSENNSFEWNFLPSTFKLHIQKHHFQNILLRIWLSHMRLCIYIYIICAHGILLGIFTKFDARDTIHVAEILLLIDNNSTSILFESNAFRFFFNLLTSPHVGWEKFVKNRFDILISKYLNKL